LPRKHKSTKNICAILCVCDFVAQLELRAHSC
jgi:hypothetical protein